MHCYRHPDRPAVAACVHCGGFVCDSCDVVAGGQHFCKACLRQMGPSSLLPARRFARSRYDRMLAGVCGGLARYFRVDPTFVRVLVVVGAVFTAFVPFALGYLILAILTPLED